MVLDRTLETTVLRSNSTQGLQLTPRVIATTFEEAVLADKTSWMLESVLRHTRKDTSKFHMRSEISALAVRVAYEGAIEGAVRATGDATPTAHRLLSHIIDDERLFAAVDPEYVHNMFMQEMSDPSKGLRAATYLFQSTELSPEHRQEFSSKDVESLFSELYKNNNWQLLGEVFKTTEHTPSHRSRILPQTIQNIFRDGLDMLEVINPKEKLVAAGLCKDLLRYTIADQRYRGKNGICDNDIEKLKDYLKNAIRIKPKLSFEEASNRSTILSVQNDLEFVEICTIASADQQYLSSLRTAYNQKKDTRTGPNGIAAHDCLKAIEAYPALKNG